MASDMITGAPADVPAPADVEASEDVLVCTECGALETGFFCRECGTLLRGGDLVLCPRCHRVVPDGDYCNQCGQTLTGIALHLRQLALAGDDFMLTSAAPAPSPTPASPLIAEPPADSPSLVPDESVDLEDAQLPDWLTELPKTRAPREVRERIYPTLRPVDSGEAASGQQRFLLVVVVLLTLALVSIVAFVLLVLTQVI